MVEQLKQLWPSNYDQLLEEEVARLRAENRALMNSLLGAAGFPPLEFPDSVKPQPLPRLRKRSRHQLQAWCQIAALRELVRQYRQEGVVARRRRCRRRQSRSLI